MKPQTVADVEGPWHDPGLESGLIERCRRYWHVPVTELPDEALATYIRQRIALQVVVSEAQRRVQGGIVDGSELYDGELARAIQDVRRASSDGPPIKPP